MSLCNAGVEPDGTRAETTFRLSPKRTSPFKSVGESVQSTAGSRGVRISVSNAGYTICRGGVRVLVTPSIPQFPLHFPSRASSCATTFRTQYNSHAQNTTALQIHCILNRNASVTGHKQGRVGYSQGKHLPRSTENSSVSNSTFGTLNFN